MSPERAGSRVVRGDRHQGVLEGNALQERAEESAVDDLDHGLLARGVAIVARLVGPLEVDVQPPVAAVFPGRDLGPPAVGVFPGAAAGRDRDHGHPREAGNPALHRHLHETPKLDAEPLGERGHRGEAVPGIAEEDEVGGELPLAPPALVDGMTVEEGKALLGELVDQRRRSPSLLAVIEGGAGLHRVTDLLARDAQPREAPIGGIRVADLCRQPAVPAPDHHPCPVAHAGLDLHLGGGGAEANLPRHGLGQGAGFLGGQVPTRAAIEDPPPRAARGEVAPKG